MAGTEVTGERVAEYERQTWMNQLAVVINQAARAGAANEAVIARVREVEQQLADGDRIRQQVQQELTESQAALQHALQERDALSGQVDSLVDALDRQQNMHDRLLEKWTAALEEQNRLRELVRIHGGDPEPPTEDDGGPDEEPRADEPEASSDGDEKPGPGAAGSVR